MGKRFWEYYLVRYLAGTIFGTLTVIFLLLNYTSPMSKSFLRNYHSPACSASQPCNILSLGYDMLFNSTKVISIPGPVSLNLQLPNGKTPIFLSSNGNKTLSMTITSTNLTVLSSLIVLVLGFLYMYFSSALILFFHTVRGTVYQVFHIKRWRRFVTGTVSVLFVTIVCLSLVPRIPLFQRSVAVFFVSIPVSFVLLLPEIQEFYFELAKRRAAGKVVEVKVSEEVKEIKQDLVTEYVESYRHLREHGNAFGIILSELVLAFLLVKTQFSLWLVAVWAVMGFMSWIVGTYLEEAFTKKGL